MSKRIPIKWRRCVSCQCSNILAQETQEAMARNELPVCRVCRGDRPHFQGSGDRRALEDPLASEKRYHGGFSRDE